MDSLRLVQVIYGEGAGKTTMALGKALRAHGNGLKVVIIQFMKSGSAWWRKEKPVIGEVNALRQLGIPVFSYGREEFIQKPISLDHELALKAWDKVISLGSTMEVLILDELLNAISFGLISEDKILEFMESKNGVELILTGRVLPEKIRAKADQVTRVISEIHPFDKGAKSRWFYFNNSYFWHIHLRHS